MERECRLVFPSESLVVLDILMQAMLSLSKAISSSVVFFRFDPSAKIGDSCPSGLSAECPYDAGCASSNYPDTPAVYKCFSK
jgi:hypothetical protein